MMKIYADNAATTKMSGTALEAMLPYMTEHFGNPSSLYTIGQEAKEGLEAARATVAACIGAQPREITFTSGGSEADNQAIRSAALLGAKKGKKHIIYFMFSFFQSTMGMGIFENMAKAALKLFHKLFMFPFLLYAIQGSRIRLPQPLLPSLPASG